MQKNIFVFVVVFVVVFNSGQRKELSFGIEKKNVHEDA